MKKILIALALLATTAPAAMAEGHKYSFDKEHTAIQFSVNHLGFSNMLGYFQDYSGHFIFDQEHPEKSSVEVALKPQSIKTSSATLDEHLQEKDWFNSAKYPEITFKSSQVAVTGQNTADVTGWINLLGKEKAAVLHVTFNKAGEYPMSKKQVAGFSAHTTIKRSDFGMINGIPFVGDEVKLVVETEGVRDD